MAIFLDGFDFWNDFNYMTQTGVYVSGSGTSGFVAPGNYSYGVCWASNGYQYLAQDFSYIQIGASPATNWPTVYMAFDFRPNQNYNNTILVSLLDGTNYQLRLQCNASGQFALYRGNGTTLLATGTKVFTLNVWYSIALKVVLNNTTGSVQVNVDGVSDITYNGDTCATANEYATQYKICYEGGNGWVCQFDNLHVYNGADAAPWNALPTVSPRVYYFLPNGDGATVDWTASAGADYQCVDENPANGDTDYIKSSTVNQISVFTKAALSNVAAVNHAQLSVALRKDDSATRGVTLKARDNGGTYYDSGEFLLTTIYGYYNFGWLLDPGTAAAWVIADFNNYQFGVEVTT